MNDKDNDSGFEDYEAEYSPKSEFSKPKVVEEVVTRCMELRAKEMRSGYFNTQISKDGLPLKQWIQDARKVYCSSVISLKQLLSPETGLDPKFKHLNFDKILKKYAYYKIRGVIVNDKKTYQTTDEYYLPEIDDGVMVRKIFPNGSEQLVLIKGYWNQQVNAYWDHMVKMCDLLFERLIKVVHNKNYFKQSIRFG